MAKELLAETDLSVAEIAKKMQFDQPQSLTRLFKKKTRISPLDYRISII
ncbi:MAG: helix-turn-helix domain-containing protein [Sphingobacterium siyangense]